MMPAAFVFLADLPLSANGKVDRKSLPKPEWAGEREYLAPRTAAEQALARIWSEVLQRPEVGIEDNFFELGGDSILSIQVISRAAQEGFALTPRQLFENPTISGLAGLAGAASAGAATAGMATTAGMTDRGPLPLTPIEHWFFAQDLTHPEHFNQALMLETPVPRGRFNAALLARAWEAVLAHHPATGLRFLLPDSPGAPGAPAAPSAPSAPSDTPRQIAGEPPTGTFGEVDLSGCPPRGAGPL